MRIDAAGCDGRLRPCGGAPAGFTLLELLVVLVLISLVATVVGIRVGGGLSGAALRDGAKKTAAILRYARSQAGWEGVPYGAVISFEDRSLELFAERPPEEDPQEEDAGPPPLFDVEEGKRTVLQTYTLPEGVRFEKAVFEGDEQYEGTFEILFSPTGGSSGGELVLINQREVRFRVRVDFITGAVQLVQDEE